MVEVVNVVASGSLDVELDLEAVAGDLDEIVDYDPDKYPGAYFRFGESAPLITLYRTGRYIVTGASSEEEAHTTRENFLNILTDHGILFCAEDEWFRVQNNKNVSLTRRMRRCHLNFLSISVLYFKY
jgi:transcription initiation factor TFIID TATA-box-binding protein